MDSEKFFDQLGECVRNVRVAMVAREETRHGSAANLQAIIDSRRHRDVLTTLIASHPEEFAGLLLALAASANETYAGVNERLSRLETALEGDGGDTVTRLDGHDARLEWLEDAVSRRGGGA